MGKLPQIVHLHEPKNTTCLNHAYEAGDDAAKVRENAPGPHSALTRSLKQPHSVVIQKVITVQCPHGLDKNNPFPIPPLLPHLQTWATTYSCLNSGQNGRIPCDWGLCKAAKSSVQ